MRNFVTVYLETVLLLVQVVARFVPNVPQAQKSFKMHLTVLLGNEALVDAHFGLFGDSAHLDTR
jgi:hypothetical protein